MQDVFDAHCKFNTFELTCRLIRVHIYLEDQVFSHDQLCYLKSKRSSRKSDMLSVLRKPFGSQDPLSFALILPMSKVHACRWVTGRGHGLQLLSDSTFICSHLVNGQSSCFQVFHWQGAWPPTVQPDLAYSLTGCSAHSCGSVSTLAQQFGRAECRKLRDCCCSSYQQGCQGNFESLRG